MSLKPNAKDWTIKEQIVEDPASGLTFQFEQDPSGCLRLRIFGDLPYGNREIIFSPEGIETGAGTLLGGCHKPAWLTDLDNL